MVDDPGVKAGLADLYRRAYAPYIEVQRRHATEAVLESSDFLAEHLHEVPMLVIPCLLTRLDERPAPADTAGFYGSILPAVWSFQLALRSRGLGSTFTTLHLWNESEAAHLLGIPETVTQVALLPVAYTLGNDFKPAPRRDAADVTYWNAWRAKA